MTFSLTTATKELLRELELACRFVPMGGLSVTSCALLVGSKDSLTIKATDLVNERLAFTSSVPAVDGEGLKIGVPVHLVTKYLRKVSEPFVTLITGDNGPESFTIKHGDSDVTFPAVLAELFPEVPEPPATKLITLSGLRKTLPRAFVAVPRDPNRFNIQAVKLLCPFQGQPVMISTDGHRMSIVNVETSTYDFDIKAVIRSSVIDEMIFFGADTADFYIDYNRHFLVMGNRCISAPPQSGTFPEHGAVIPKAQNFVNTAVIDPRVLMAHGDRVGLLADEKRSMEFKFGDGLTLTASTTGKGAAVAKIPCAYTGASDFTIQFNWFFILDFCKYAGTEKIDFNMQSSRSNIVMLETDGWKYVCMPMSLYY